MLYQIIFCVFAFRNPSWYKKNIALLHTLSAYNSLLVYYQIYSSHPKEYLCTSWRYAEAYKNSSFDPGPCQKNPIKNNKIVTLNCQPLLLGENYKSLTAKVCLVWPYFYQKLLWNKSVRAKVSLENLVRNVLKESKFEREHLGQLFDKKSWYWKKKKKNTYKSWVIYYLLNLPPPLLISFSETTATLLLSEQLATN